jgi:dolichol kinase
MKFISIILLISSILLVISSSWSLCNFTRLEYTSKKYKTDTMLEEACNISKNYTKNGKLISTVSLVISIVLLITSSIVIYKEY